MNFGRHPLTPLAREMLPLRELGMDMPGVEFLSQQMEEVWVNTVRNLRAAQDRFKSYADNNLIDRQKKFYALNFTL
jgi:hypothetical protein